MRITPKAIEALVLLVGTSSFDTRSASALASRLWPDRLVACGTSRCRGGLYRAAGAYYSKLQKQGLVGYWVDECDRWYYITKFGIETLTQHTRN